MNQTQAELRALEVKVLLEKAKAAKLTKQAPAPSKLPVEPRVNPLEPVPLSFAQQRLWFIDQLDARAGAAYHIPAGLRLRGALHRDALQAALDRIVERHEALRTCFALVDGQPVQLIAAQARFALAVHDLSGHADPQAAAQDEAEQEAAAAFDLAAGPLIRGRLLKLAPDDHVLLVTMHHIVS